MSLNTNPLKDLTDDELREKLRESTRKLRELGLTDAEIFGLDEAFKDHCWTAAGRARALARSYASACGHYGSRLLGQLVVRDGP